MEWFDPSGDTYKKACRIVRSLMPMRLRKAYDAEDFVMDAIMELLGKDGTGDLLVLVARRRMLDAAKSPKNRDLGLTMDIPGRTHDDTESILEGVDDLDLRDIFRLKMEGYGLTEVSDMTGLGTRKIQRKIEKFRKSVK